MDTVKIIKRLTFCSIMVALGVVLDRFLAINTPILSISFGFITTIVVAQKLGIKYSIAVSALKDLISSLLFPTGPYFFGFTLSAILVGISYGLLFKKDEVPFKKYFLRVVICCLINNLLIRGILNTLWIMILYNKNMLALLPLRMIKQCVFLPIEVLFSLLSYKYIVNRINLN